MAGFLQFSHRSDRERTPRTVGVGYQKCRPTLLTTPDPSFRSLTHQGSFFWDVGFCAHGGRVVEIAVVPARRCLHPGCNKLVQDASRCAAHSLRKRGVYGSEYKRERERVLAAAVVCWICGKPRAVGDPFEADHIVPVAKGGGTKGNLAAAHRSCNTSRGGRTRSRR